MRYYFFLLFIIIMFLNCSSKKDEEKKHKAEDDVFVADTPPYIDIIMENDTLDTKLEKGVIKYFYRINDTIKLSSNDEKWVQVTLALGALGENKEKFGAGKKIKKELHFNPINTHDTLSIPFAIKPHFSGKGVVIGVLSDMYFIHTSVKDTLRVLTYESTIEKNVYIK